MRAAVLAILLATAASPALATDFTAPLLDLNGKVAPRCAAKTPECEKPLTLGYISATALLAEYPDEVDQRTRISTVTGLDKAKRAQLALRVLDAKNLDLASADTAQIIALVGKAFPPLTVLLVMQALDPAAVPKAE